MDLKERIRAKSAKYLGEITGYRRHIHSHPELSYREEETAAFVEKILRGWGLDPLRVAETGVTGLIEGSSPGACVVLRAELDALPILEENQASYRSLHDGVMHACGHDVHAAALLGAIRILLDLKDSWRGTVRYLFQPAEEVLPGGASAVIASKILQHPRPDAIIAQHVFPELETGRAGYRAGAYMASSDEVYIEVLGKGGHAALPQQLVDPVPIAAQLILALQQIVSRHAPPDVPTVLSFGKVNAPGATNVVPDKVWLEGTFRTFSESWRARAHQLIRSMAEGLAGSMGAAVECRIVKGNPSLVNHEGLSALLAPSMAEYLGESQVEELPIRMGSEDFARYGALIPAFFYRLGTAIKERRTAIHTSTFDVDEKSLEYGTGLLAYLAITLLSRPAGS